MKKELHSPNSAFSKELPTLQLAWDSTSLGLLKQCPRKYYYSMIEQWSKKGGAIPLTFGIAYHKALEYFDKAKALGKDHEEAVNEAIKVALETTGERDASGAFTSWKPEDTKRNNFTLVRALVWYLENFKDDPAQTVLLDDGSPAVELSFKMDFPMDSLTGEKFLLCGHMDRLVEFGDSTYVLDYKTTGGAISAYYFKGFSPDNQISLYTLASNIVLNKKAAGVIIDAVQLLVSGHRFARGIINRSEGQLNEWVENTTEYIKMAERWAESHQYPQNDTACDKYGGCQFRDICSSDPGVRERLLKTEFEKKIWNPLENR